LPGAKAKKEEVDPVLEREARSAFTMWYIAMMTADWLHQLIVINRLRALATSDQVSPKTRAQLHYLYNRAVQDIPLVVSRREQAYRLLEEGRERGHVDWSLDGLARPRNRAAVRV